MHAALYGRLHIASMFWYALDMGRAIAYFITWTTRGTWLHGDERGSVDREHNTFRTAHMPPNETTRLRRERFLNDPPVRLNAAARDIVDSAIQEVCRRRRWNMLAIAVRSNHVHVVVGADAAPERVMQQLKSWGTRALCDAGCFSPGRGIWTRHGGTRYLWDDQSVSKAVSYVMKEQDRIERFLPREGHSDERT